jgi:hypothetical protein
VRMAVIGAMVAGGLLAALPVAHAAGPDPKCPADWNADGVVDIDDLFVAVANFGTGSNGIDDVFAVMHGFGTMCPTAL